MPELAPLVKPRLFVVNADGSGSEVLDTRAFGAYLEQQRHSGSSFVDERPGTYSSEPGSKSLVVLTRHTPASPELAPLPVANPSKVVPHSPSVVPDHLLHRPTIFKAAKPAQVRKE